MIDWLTNLFDKGVGLVQAGMILVLIFVIASTWFKSRALIPTAIVAVTGGAVLWMVNHYQWLEDKTGTEFGAIAPVSAPVGTDRTITTTDGRVIHVTFPTAIIVTADQRAA